MAARDKILVIQMAKFGDFLQTTPLLSALRASKPDADISVLVDEGRKSLAKKYTEIDHVLGVNLTALKEVACGREKPSKKISAMHRILGNLLENRYDRVINLNTSRLSALIGELARADERHGPNLADNRREMETSLWANFIMRLMENRRLNRFNLVDLYRTYAGPVDGEFPIMYPISGQAETNGLPGVSSGPVIGIQAGSRHSDRQWPKKNYARLARRLILEESATIVLFGTRDEKPIGRTIIEKVTRTAPGLSDKIIDLTGKTSIDDLAGVLSGLDALVTGDTGTMHLASAMKTKILALFMGPAWCHETGPYGAGHMVLQAAPDCSPCREGSECPEGHRCRHLITPDLAFEAISALTRNDARVPIKGLPDEVRVYRSIMDRFGAAYYPAQPGAMDMEEIMALAWREAGRGLIRPEYQSELDFETIEAFGFHDHSNELERMRDLLGLVESGLVSGTGVKTSLTRQAPLLSGVLAWMASAVPGKQVTRFVRDMKAVIHAARGHRSTHPKELSKIAEKYYNDSSV